MKQELQEQLFAIEPSFFNRKDPQNSLMCFGFECGDGWFILIEQLIKSAKWNKENPRWVPDELRSGFYRKPFECFPDTREGWLKNTLRVKREETDLDCPYKEDSRNIRDFYCIAGKKRKKDTDTFLGTCDGCESSNKYIYYQHICERPWNHFQFLQVKEKFGSLRVYTIGITDEFQGMIHFAEIMSEKICEACGSWGKLRNNNSWLMTLCSPCFKKYLKKYKKYIRVNNEKISKIN